MISVGIVGATGYTGEELLRLLYSHPNVQVKFITSRDAGVNIEEHYPNLTGFYDMTLVQYNKSLLKDVDVIFIALPHGHAEPIVLDALEAGIKVIDLGADFRFDDPDLYEAWYHIPAPKKELLSQAIYGLPELHRDKIKTAQLIGNPGCYVTCSILTLAPAIANDLIDFNSIIIDAKSGISGAGRAAKLGSHFVECNENMHPYNIGTHRHTGEIEKELSLLANERLTLSFTPHLTPMSRGILSTCYGTIKRNISLDEIKNLYLDFYKEEGFVKVLSGIPQTKFVKGSNLCHIHVDLDERTNRLIAVGAIDNLMKGASGQAVQNMNIMFGLDEKTALDTIPIF